MALSLFGLCIPDILAVANSGGPAARRNICGKSCSQYADASDKQGMGLKWVLP
jgi:hypothetical protein